MSVGFFFPKLVRYSFTGNFLFSNHRSKVCNFSDIELKTKSYTRITIIRVK